MAVSLRGTPSKVVQGDAVAGDKAGHDKVGGDKITVNNILVVINKAKEETPPLRRWLEWAIIIGSLAQLIFG